MNISHASLVEWGSSHIKLRKDMIILDVGCGGGANINRFAQFATDGRVFGIDYSPTSVKVSKEVNKKYIEEGIVEIRESSVSYLPFEDNTFDVVSGFEAYYFWPDLINDLKEIRRVLKINGVLLLVNEGYKCENKEIRKIVEIFGRFYHDPNSTTRKIKYNRTEKGRIEYFKQHNYDTLVIWEEELAHPQKVIQKVQQFLGGEI